MLTPPQIADLRQKRYNATVSRLVKVHSDLMLMRVRPDFTRPQHKPGQYSMLGLGYWEPRIPGCDDETLQPDDESKLARRAYSISCPVLNDSHTDLLDLSQTDWLEFYIVLVRKACTPQAPVLTPRLFMLREGDRLFLGARITGHYNLDAVQPSDTVLFLSTGTGEAPHNYMIWDLLRRGHAGRILSACCVRYARDLAYLPMHEQLMRMFPSYTYLSLTTRENLREGRKVYVQDLITSGQLEAALGSSLSPATTHVFLCGNPAMIGVPNNDPQTGERVYPQPTGVVEILERRGFQVDQANAKIKGNIHYEEYW
jgi:ferredoxin--NADP+ reductase